jgi:ceramide glucosyltransferase
VRRFASAKARAMKTALAILFAVSACVAARLYVPHVSMPMAALLLLPAFLCALGASFGTLYSLYAALLTWRFFGRSAREPAEHPAVTIVKPLHGNEETLFENLASFCRQDYTGPIQFLFGVHDGRDDALEAVAKLRTAFPKADIEVVANATLYGPNRKISNIVNMLPAARHDLLIFADSDVSVGRDYVRHIVGELERPEVGLVTCAYRARPCAGLWTHVEAQATDYQFLPGVMAGLALGLARPCFGQTIAMRRATFEHIGGFAQFAHHLAEDYAIGEAVRATGAQVAVPPFVVWHGCVETDFAKMTAHALRWSRTIRAVDPGGHAGSVLTYPCALALLTVVLSGLAPWSWALFAATLSARLLAMLLSDRALRVPTRRAWLLPLSELVAFGVFMASFASSRVVWRGFSFDVDREGRLHPAPELRGNA